MSRTESAAAHPMGQTALPALGRAVIVVAPLTALRVALLFLTDLQLYGDEAQYWSYGQELAFGHYSKPPMAGWVSYLTTSIGGFGEAWVRLGSPLLHGASALLLFQLARGVYDERTALWAAIGYATLPAVSYASLLLSTDTPLLFFWVLALLALWRLQQGAGLLWSGLLWAGLLAVGVGGGLLSKYAMAYLFVGLAVYAALSADGRALLRRRSLWLGLGLGLLLWSPNLWWNLQHGGATLVHVTENASPDNNPWRPGEAIAWFGAQFGVVGPVFFAALLIRLALATRRRLGAPERFLIAFSVPVLAIIQVQALLAGANANWAAVAVPAAAVLATGWLIALGQWLWIKLALAIHAVAVVVAAVFAVWPGAIVPAAGAPALAQLRGWQAFADRVDRRAAACDCEIVLLDHRFELGQLWYYGDIDPQRLRMWVTQEITNHYELTRPFHAPADRRTLYVTERRDPTSVVAALGPVEARGSFTVATGPGLSRSYKTFVIAPEPESPGEAGATRGDGA